jgi:hypothetical protein
MNELVKKLSTGQHAIVVSRKRQSVEALEDRLKINSVPVMFKDTGTEINIYLDRAACNTGMADFKTGKGKLHLEGVVTLNDETVLCVVDVALESLEGVGSLNPVTHETYNDIIGKTTPT